MAPKLVMSNKRCNMNNKHNNFTVKKLNQYLKINAHQRKRIEQLSSQNKELSTTRNNLLLYKLELENENRSLKNANVQLLAMHHTIQKKLNAVEQTLQKCVPALVTMSQCVPDILINVREMSQFDKINEINNKEKKERQTKTVRPMINGMTINQPAVSLHRLDMSPIIESPNSEHTPKHSRRSSNRNSTQCKLNLEPYVRLKDVAVLLKNSKAVPNENSPRRQLNESFGEGPSWLHSPRNQNQNSENIIGSVIENCESSSPILNETSMVTERETLIVHEVQTDMSTSASSSNDNMNVTLNQTDRGSIQSNDSMSESTMLKNITCRKRPTRSSGERSITSAFDINDSVSSQASQRSRRSARKEVNYQEPKLITKLRRN